MQPFIFPPKGSICKMPALLVLRGGKGLSHPQTGGPLALQEIEALHNAENSEETYFNVTRYLWCSVPLDTGDVIGIRRIVFLEGDSSSKCFITFRSFMRGYIIQF
ncbi:hypothetical protein AVEN_208986-1 [Araneus ventricosus]|uniref:Uncharacterized protein n=1 Tax=Araneus ventricosus TaxID=182803 RepID=A0A4Y2CR09_ARAVE|nr:hypothetical protein AVEN_208986-1 [Araneus ventricosus]